MEILDFFKEKLNLDLIIIILVLGAGFFQKKYLYTPWNKKDSSHDGAIKTLATSAAFTIVYLILLHLQDKTQPIPAVRSFVTYCVTTSFYELLLKPLMKLWADKTGQKDIQP